MRPCLNLQSSSEDYRSLFPPNNKSEIWIKVIVSFISQIRFKFWDINRKIKLFWILPFVSEFCLYLAILSLVATTKLKRQLPLFPHNSYFSLYIFSLYLAVLHLCIGILGISLIFLTFFSELQEKSELCDKKFQHCIALLGCTSL